MQIFESLQLDPLLARAELRARARRLSVGSRFVSRTYSDRWAMAAFSTTPVGIDLETIQIQPSGFAETICTPQELEQRIWLHLEGGLTSVWASKEALAKALGNPLDLDPRRLTSPLLWSNGRNGPWRISQVRAPVGLVSWMVFRTQALQSERHDSSRKMEF